MKRYFPICLILLASFAINFLAYSQAPRSTSANNQTKTRQPEILTNESIISLVRADFKEKTILTLIKSSFVNFDLSAQKLIVLKKNGVNENVIQAMIERQSLSQDTGSLRDDEFFNADDEAFFKKAPKLSLPEMSRKNSGENTESKTKETDIFGSRSGGKSSTRTRGGGLDKDSNSEISGSATVRIIKPPSESSDEPKLERAHKLTNQEIIDMVQAGFSEGTILRKIEITQVEFDVSTKAQETLRKNRVSEKVLQAMREAMNESK